MGVYYSLIGNGVVVVLIQRIRYAKIGFNLPSLVEHLIGYKTRLKDGFGVHSVRGSDLYNSIKGHLVLLAEMS